MSGPRVLIVGCGIAGPVLALLLQKKGYTPIVLEKVKELGDVGGSLMMMPNGYISVPITLFHIQQANIYSLKVLSLLSLGGIITHPVLSFCDQNSTGEILGVSDLPAGFQIRYGAPVCGVKRATLNLALKAALHEAGIPLYEGWQLESLNENTNGVVATAVDGRTESANFLVGCDGIKSAVRSVILAQHRVDENRPTFTGLTQAGGISPTPPAWREVPMKLNVYGDGVHLIAYPISATQTSWAITRREHDEVPETWQDLSDEGLEKVRAEMLHLIEGWGDDIGELVGRVGNIIKFGLYDRPGLESKFWHSTGGTCVLVGDAAHPTSPHLGQGANQALEDCYHLCRLLPDVHKGVEVERTVLKGVFESFASIRQPRTAALVVGARKQGEERVVCGVVQGRERDQRVRVALGDTRAVKEGLDGLLKEPFEL